MTTASATCRPATALRRPEEIEGVGRLPWIGEGMVVNRVSCLLFSMRNPPVISCRLFCFAPISYCMAALLIEMYVHEEGKKVNRVEVLFLKWNRQESCLSY